MGQAAPGRQRNLSDHTRPTLIPGHRIRAGITSASTISHTHDPTDDPKVVTIAGMLVTISRIGGHDPGMPGHDRPEYPSVGTTRVFCVPGESYLPVLEALRHSVIETITARHESAAGYMALADSRITGLPGVVMVSRGPGATNASIAVHTSQQDGLPLLVFIGQVERKHLRRDGFQEIDYAVMFSGIAKWIAEVRDPQDLPQILNRAYTTAMSGTPGPVVISLPEDLLELDVVAQDNTPPTCQAPASGAPQELVALAVKRLDAAVRPLVIAGKELSAPGARETLIAFAERFSVPVAVSFRRHDLFPNDHPLYAGDMSSTNTAGQLKLFESADLVLALGTRLGDLTTHGYTFPRSPWPAQDLIHVYNDASIVGRHYNPSIAAACRAPDFMRVMLQDSGNANQTRTEWAQSLHGQAIQRSTWTPRQFDDGIAFAGLVTNVSHQAADDVSVVPDAGISAAQIYKYFSFRGRRRLYATMAGVMGFGIPGSIAIAMREPARKVICFVGDGGFMMTGFDLAIAVQKQLPICIFLANNRSLGTIYFHQEKQYPGGAHATDLPGPDFTLIAQSFGCPFLTIDHDQDIERVVAKALSMKGPVLVDVKTSLLSLKS